MKFKVAGYNLHLLFAIGLTIISFVALWHIAEASGVVSFNDPNKVKRFLIFNAILWYIPSLVEANFSNKTFSSIDPGLILISTAGVSCLAYELSNFLADQETTIFLVPGALVIYAFWVIYLSFRYDRSKRPYSLFNEILSLVIGILTAHIYLGISLNEVMTWNEVTPWNS